MNWEAGLEKRNKVEVEWIDSSTDNGWEFSKNIKVDDGKLCYSTGYLLGHTIDFIILVGDIDPHEKAHNRPIQIPRVAIKGIYQLSKGRNCRDKIKQK